MKLTLGFSPCPNDTFIFDALVNGKIDTRELSFDYVLEDVETLNKWAEAGKLDITKISFSAFLHATDQYSLLETGSALGKGVGPLLVAKNDVDNTRLASWLLDKNIAIPGKNTTANLLFSLAFPSIKNKQEMIFSDIEEAVISGTCAAGVIIHEGRFTYESKGLKKLMDLGSWWEEHTGAMIPLGGIAIKKNFPDELCKKLDTVMKESLDYAWKNYPQLSAFVTAHAQEMKEEVMRQHIELYVNEYSSALGNDGRAAILRLFEEAVQAGIIQQFDVSSIFC